MSVDNNGSLVKTHDFCVFRFRHKSYIEVNEEGSEAAAATALFGFRSARPLFHTEFVANHPFIFFIYDEETDLILFHGVLQDPTVNFW